MREKLKDVGLTIYFWCLLKGYKYRKKLGVGTAFLGIIITSVITAKVLNSYKIVTWLLTLILMGYWFLAFLSIGIGMSLETWLENKLRPKAWYD